MKLRDIHAAISAEADITIAAAEAALHAVLGCINRGLRTGDRVNLPGVGSLSPVRRKARRALHPATGTALVIPARIAVKFTPAAAMLAQLNAVSGEHQ